MNTDPPIVTPTVVGFDPGLQLTGFGVLDVRGHRPRLLEAGILRVPTGRPLAERLDHLYQSALELLEEHRPGVVAIEDLFSHYKRPKTAILMGHARGVLLLAAARVGAEVASYLPTRVKKSTTGSGRASKEQMQIAIQAEFSLPAPPHPPDVADALAIALTHFHAQRMAG